jgi:hypothetical protein
MFSVSQEFPFSSNASQATRGFVINAFRELIVKNRNPKIASLTTLGEGPQAPKERKNQRKKEYKDANASLQGLMFVSEAVLFFPSHFRISCLRASNSKTASLATVVEGMLRDDRSKKGKRSSRWRKRG